MICPSRDIQVEDARKVPPYRQPSLKIVLAQHLHTCRAKQLRLPKLLGAMRKESSQGLCADYIRERRGKGPPLVPQSSTAERRVGAAWPCIHVVELRSSLRVVYLERHPGIQAPLEIVGLECLESAVGSLRPVEDLARFETTASVEGGREHLGLVHATEEVERLQCVAWFQLYPAMTIALVFIPCLEVRRIDCLQPPNGLFEDEVHLILVGEAC